MLSIHYRFHGHGSLRYVYKNGQTVRTRLITLKYLENPRRTHSRFSVVISKKVLKSAVGRNRIRRRVYEAIRHELPDIAGVYDVVVMVFAADVRELTPDELTALVRDLFTQAGIYKK